MECCLPSTVTASSASSGDGSLDQRLTALESKVAKHDFDVSVLTNWADIMYKDHRSLQKQVFFNTSRTHANDLLIGGIYEFKQQDYKEAAIKFFKEKLKLTFKDKDVLSARWIGGRKRLVIDDENAEDGTGKRTIFCPCHMVVCCSPHFRSVVWDNKKALAG